MIGCAGRSVRQRGVSRTVLPVTDLVDVEPAALRADVLPALAVAAMSVPQGLAWALVAGLPPALGLWAATVPTVVAALARSSRTTVVGPTNAMCVLLATTLAGEVDPAAAAAALACWVGVLQLGVSAGALTRGVDLVHGAVVTGLVVGAATLMLVGVLPHATGGDPVAGHVVARASAWVATLPRANPWAVALAAGTVVTIVGLRRRLPRGVPMLLATAGGTAAAVALALPVRALGTGGVPLSWPPFGLPASGPGLSLLPVAAAATVLSLVETAAIDRAGGERTGQRTEPRLDAAGLGLANLAAGLFGGLPVSGSLGRSALLVQLGAKTRLAGVAAAVVLLAATPALGPVVAKVPVPVIAGVVLVAAFDLVEPARLRAWWTSAGDRAALVATVLAVWFLPFDQAVGVGVVASAVMYLRRARLLQVRELWTAPDGAPLEVDPAHPPALPPEHRARCSAIAQVVLEGPLFFGSAGELEDALAPYVDDDELRVLVVRARRASGLDGSAARVLRHTHEVLARTGRQLLLVGAPPPGADDAEDAAVTRELGPTGVPAHPTWVRDPAAALARARATVGDHACGPRCPLGSPDLPPAG